MTDEAQKNDQTDASRRTQPPEDPRPQPALLSDEAIEQMEQEILSGTGVGYKHPPRATRFKKGQSGNPKGRPKKVADDIGPAGDRSISSIILKEAARKVTIREGDVTKEITRIEAVIRAQHVSAITNGSAYAQKHIIERYDRAERERRRERDESIEFWTDYKERVSVLFAEAEKHGEPPPDILPHPDDVVIDYEKGVRIIGPINKEEATELEDTIKLRDLHIMQHVLEERQADDLDGPDRPGTASLIAMRLNNVIPPRLRLSDSEMAMRILHYRGTPRRQLLKELYRAWREIGAPRPRGWTYPPQWWGEKFLGAYYEAMGKIARGEGDITSYIEPLYAILLEGVARKDEA